MPGKRRDKIIARIARIGVNPDDSEDLKLQKSLLILFTFPFIFAGTVWGIMYVQFGEKLAGAIPLSYSVFSLLSIVYFSITKAFKVFRFSQLLLILLLPFALMLALGGFINGSGVILWGLICPLGATLFDNPSGAMRWFILFLILLIVSGVLESWLPAD